MKVVVYDIWVVYIMTFGAAIFFGILIGMTFFNMVTKQRTIAMAVLVVLLTGTSIWTLFPPEYVEFAEILFVLGISGIFYWLIIRRR